MEDPESEWKIQEYYSSSKEDDDDDDDDEDKPTVVRRILTNGYVIGREIVITGIFISSAPLVVPPLVAFSAVGFVFSVPFGVLFASYACTNKIMSLLLPSPLRLEYYSGGVEQEDDEMMDCKLGLDDGGGDDYGELDDCGPDVEGYVTDKEDNELVEGVNQEVDSDEIEFEFGDDYNRQEGGSSIGNVDQVVDEMEMEADMLHKRSITEEKEREQVEDVKQGVELSPGFDVAGGDDQELSPGFDVASGDDQELNPGFDVASGDDQELNPGFDVSGGDDQELSPSFGVLAGDDDQELSPSFDIAGDDLSPSFDVAGGDDQGYEEDAREYLEGDDDSFEEELKGEEPPVENRIDENISNAHEVNGDVKSRDEGRVDNKVEDDHVDSESASDVVFGDDKDVETTKPVTVVGIESEKLAQVGGKNNESVGDMHHVVFLSDGGVGEMKMEMEDDMLQRENDTEEKEGEQVEDVMGVEMRPTFDVASNDDQEYMEDAREYLEGDHDSLEELNGEKPLVVNRQEVNEVTKVIEVGSVDNTVEDDCIVSVSASNAVLGDAKAVETTKPVTSVSASNVVFGDTKDVETTIPVTSESASDVVFGDVKDVGTTNRVASESASDVVFGDVKDVGTTIPVSVSASDVIFGVVKDVGTIIPVTSESAYNVVNDVETNKLVKNESDANVVLGDVETTTPVTNESASNATFGDVKDVKTTGWVTSERASNVVSGDVKDVETTETVIVIEIDSQKLVEVGNKSDEPAYENNVLSREAYTLGVVAREVTGDATEDRRTIKFDEKVERVSTASKDGSEDAILRTMGEHATHSNADGDECGVDLMDDQRNTNNNLESLGDGNEVNKNADVDNVDVLACSPSKRDMDNGNGVKENAGNDNVDAADDNVEVLARSPTTRDTDNAKVAYKKMPSREEKLDDEKMWEKIAAMRRIVGYKAPSQSTCIGELKALYVFTGVEPPASFEADSDLDAKLKFLMAIVGVK